MNQIDYEKDRCARKYVVGHEIDKIVYVLLYIDYTIFYTCIKSVHLISSCVSVRSELSWVLNYKLHVCISIDHVYKTHLTTYLKRMAQSCSSIFYYFVHVYTNFTCTNFTLYAIHCIDNKFLYYIYYYIHLFSKPKKSTPEVER